MPVTITHNSHTHDRLTQAIVGKLWNLCNVFKEDGVTYHQNVTEPHLSAPVTLTKLVSEIDKLDWYSARQEGLGDLYEGLLQKNAEKKTRRGPILHAKAPNRCDVGGEGPQRRTGERTARTDPGGPSGGGRRYQPLAAWSAPGCSQSGTETC